MAKNGDDSLGAIYSRGAGDPNGPGGAPNLRAAFRRGADEISGCLAG